MVKRMPTAACYATFLLTLACVGCQKRPPNHLSVCETRSDAAAEHYEDFDRAYFRKRHDGQIDLILIKETTGGLAEDGAEMRQMVHLRTLWRSHPGRTYANASMINARMSYCLFRGSAAISYDGSGFMHCKESGDGHRITGKITGGMLHPLRQVGEDLRIFEHISVSGRFKATEDERRVARYIEDIGRWLGPLPALDAPVPGP